MFQMIYCWLGKEWADVRGQILLLDYSLPLLTFKWTRGAYSILNVSERGNDF